MKTLIDRPHATNNRNLDKMVAELSKYMTELEIDRVVEFMVTIDTSKFDINYSTGDAAVQLKILLGSERYEIIKSQWAQKNQHLIKDGAVKFIHIESGRIFDGLHPEDNPLEYKRILM
jgi:hypothetical protein